MIVVGTLDAASVNFYSSKAAFFSLLIIVSGWITGRHALRHHLAILHVHYLREILAGLKTIECRFSRIGNPPHRVVSPGDMIWTKEVGGPVRGVVAVREVRFFENLTPSRLEKIRQRWGRSIGASESFWRYRKGMEVVTLMWLGEGCGVRPFRIRKRDRKAWVVLDGPLVPGQWVGTGDEASI